MGLLAQYINITINFALVSKDSKQNSEIVPDLMTYNSFFEEFCKYSEGDAKVHFLFILNLYIKLSIKKS